MAKNVRTIPATISRFTATPLTAKEKRKVAAYARVSTDHEEQQSSYEAQVDYYTNYIKGRDDWEFAGLYSDEGISATNTKHRDGFNSMVQDALAGKIDLIITKSVSRFARNTVDSLSTIRKLKENGCECYFEKENIWTFDAKGELLITIMSSLAQEESRSISENTTWGQRKRFADGKVTVPFGRFLGYDRGPDGNLVVNVQEFEPVFLYLFAKQNTLGREINIRNMKQNIENSKRRIKELDMLIERIYEDNVLGKISDERFCRMSANYEKEQKELLAAVENDEQTVRKAEQEKIDLKVFLEAIRECTDLKELTPTIVNTLIKRIEIHNSEKGEDGLKHVPVDISFTAVGIINIPTEKELIAAMEEMRENPLKSA